ncbi:HxlR family transcriptional regulator [Mycobacterium sp. 1165196.3]|uniref:winged helix-turn-helix transcriptional regulator n=1 Tax=unclassified Mycobacterium TaxID=2642494 RepID=UPI00080024EF|nr:MULTISPECIES: helix-turn-helix domain-containing protein [unclassified Mycobacterium]OBJ04288.1 HxlR family transcriptional regulator [Mycobacterium sp. 1482292.6]OBK34386.1 HxlR family transcriptional regulator [Mycobacterium sp. 1165196.3]
MTNGAREGPLLTPAVRGTPCSIAAALEIIGDRWSLLILREVNLGHHRFSDMVRNTGASRDRLAARLKALVAAGVLERIEYQQSPSLSAYHLTDAGRELSPVLHVLRQWGDRWAVARPPVTVRHRDHELRLGGTCDVCGEPVHEDDVTRVRLGEDA